MLIPLWQKIHGAPRADRVAFAGAMGIYVLAKLAELADHPVAAFTGLFSVHNLKHLLASLAAALIVARLAQRAAAPDNSRLCLLSNASQGQIPC